MLWNVLLLEELVHTIHPAESILFCSVGIISYFNAFSLAAFKKKFFLHCYFIHNVLKEIFLRGSYDQVDNVEIIMYHK